MQTKLFEIRDRMTCILAMATVADDDLTEKQALWKRGFDPNQRYVFLYQIGGNICTYDPYAWDLERTMPEAHRYIEANWDALDDRAVIDVEVIKEEKVTASASELF